MVKVVPRRRVVIVQEMLPDYRVPFFEGLRRMLGEYDVELDLVHGDPQGDRARHGDSATLPWASVVRNRHLRIGATAYLVWQPVLRRAFRADLVIVEQANKHLVNLILMTCMRRRLALWGHGATIGTAAPRSLSRNLKRMLSFRCGWWFAYTAGVAHRLSVNGFPKGRITTVQNAVRLPAVKAELRRAKQCAFVGSLADYKRIDFLLEAGRIIAETTDDFRLVIAGDGPRRDEVLAAAMENEWLDYRGRIDDSAKASLLKESSVLLMPGLVGLVAVDSFVAETPIVTVDDAMQNPEFEYLDDRNSIVLDRGCSAEAYAERVVAVLNDPIGLAQIRAGCAASGRSITIDEMVRRFGEGVLHALGQQRG